jgi:hypothetical protein
MHDSDLEQRGVAVPGSRIGDIHEIPGPADIDAERQHGGSVSEQTGQHRRPENHVITLPVQHPGQNAYRVATRAERRQGGDVEILEQPP